jgi:4,5-dihydroxyphthalate decarboxylase
MLHLSLALGDADLHRGLLDGTVPIEGCDAAVVAFPAAERHRRFLRHGEFDACELSLGSYLAALGSGRFTAVPVFPHRRFRHHDYFVRTGAGIVTPQDLEGRAVALRTWQTTAGLWMRGILQHEHGVDLARIRWVTHDEEEVPGVRPPFPVERRADRDPEELLLAGEVDAALCPETLPSFRRGDPRVARLFPDAKEEEMAYHRRTGVFPIMHLLAVRRGVAEANPWLPRNLMRAFERSKQLAYRRLGDPSAVSLAWLTPLYEEQLDVLGPDPWASGLTDGNRKALGAALLYAEEQGILPKAPRPDDLFWPAALDGTPGAQGG